MEYHPAEVDAFIAFADAGGWVGLKAGPGGCGASQPLPVEHNLQHYATVCAAHCPLFACHMV